MSKQESENFENELRRFGQSIRAEAEKPDAFWMSQQARIREKLQHPLPASRRPAILVWAPVTAILVFCLFWFMEPSRELMPDIATGFDQRLLVEVEQALKQSSPDALAPAGLITEEIRSAAGGQ
jgi:hypothetical protein